MASKLWGQSTRWIFLFLSFCITGTTCEAYLTWSRWSRWSSCSVTCGKGMRIRRRQCVDTSRSSKNTGCSGPTEMYSPCQLLACPEVQTKYCNCGCHLRGPYGMITSSLPYKDTKTCRWTIKADKGTGIELTVSKLELKTGWLRINSGSDDKIFIRPGVGPPLPTVIKSKTDEMLVEFVSYMMPTPDKDSAKFKASFKQVGTARKNVAVDTSDGVYSKGPNVPAIAGITACAAIILIAALVVIIRRLHSSDHRTDVYDNPEPQTAFETDITPQQRPIRNHLTPMLQVSKGSTSSASGSVNSHKYQVPVLLPGKPPEIRQWKDSAYESEGQRFSQDERDNERTPWKPDQHHYLFYQQPVYNIRLPSAGEETTSVIYHVDGASHRGEPIRTMRPDTIPPDKEARV